MGVPSYQLTTNFSANCQLTTIFLANCQLTTNSTTELTIKAQVSHEPNLIH